MKYFFSLLTLWGICFVTSAATVIHGQANHYAGQTLKLEEASDPFTNLTKVVGECVVGLDGNFRLEADLTQTSKRMLRIGDVTAFIYTEPNLDYHINIPPPSATDALILSKEKVVQVEFLGDHQEDLNLAIIGFNEKYDQFVADNFHLFLHKKAQPVVDSFLVVMRNEFDSNPHPYFKDYTKFNYAHLELTSGKSRKRIYETYLKEKRPDFYNDAYLFFFQQVYQETFRKQFTRTDRKKAILRSINFAKDPGILLDLLSDDAMLQDEEIREIVALNELYTNYNNPTFHQVSVKQVIKALGDQSNFPQHKVYADNILKSLSTLQPGSKAPDFRLTNLADSLVSLSGYQGRFVYLQFWAPWCTSCIHHMSIMQELKTKYGESFSFISVNLENDKFDMEKALRSYDYNWEFLFGKDGAKLRKDYAIKTVPAYFLIDQDGKFIQVPAPDPQGDIEIMLNKIDRLEHPEKYDKSNW